MFRRVVLPLSIPALAAFAIFQFLWVWNDLLVALVFLSAETEQSVMTLELSKLVGGRGQAWHLLTAGAFVTMILPVLGVPAAAALLRAGHPVRLRQGLSVAPDRHADADDVLGQLLPAFGGHEPPAWLLRRVAAGRTHGATLFLRANTESAAQLADADRAAAGRRSDRPAAPHRGRPGGRPARRPGPCHHALPGGHGAGRGR